MEDVIVYLVIAASIVASIFNNYKKQKTANQKRDIRKPAPQASSVPPAEQTVPRPRPAVKTANSRPAITQREIKPSVSVPQYEFGKYDSLEYKASTLGSKNIADFETPEGFEEELSIEEQERIEQQGGQHKSFDLFENRDDLKKAVLYKEILDRRY